MKVTFICLMEIKGQLKGDGWVLGIAQYIVQLNIKMSVYQKFNKFNKIEIFISKLEIDNRLRSTLFHHVYDQVDKIK